MQLSQFHCFWELVDRLPTIKHAGDQSLLSAVALQFPDHVGTLPAHWDTHLGHGWRRHPHQLLTERHGTGMLHFTGPRGGGTGSGLRSPGFFSYFCDRTTMCRHNQTARDMYWQTWGLADFYARVPWTWAKHFRESAIPIDGDGNHLSITFLSLSPAKG